MDINIGKKIQAILVEKHLSNTEFARLLGYNPKGIKRLLSKPHLHCQLLMQISQVLQHDFFQYYSTETQLLKTQNQQLNHKIHQLEKKVESLNADNNYLNKTIQLLLSKEK